MMLSAAVVSSLLARTRKYGFGLTGWRHNLAAVMLGLASVLAMAPFFIWPILFVTLPCLIWLIDGRLLVPAAKDITKPGARWHRLEQRPATIPASVRK